MPETIKAPGTLNDGDKMATEPPHISERFHSSDADVEFISSDRVLFSIHRKNLETHAGGFPPPEFETDDQAVPLTEDGDILDLLFQTMYPYPTPDIASLPFETLESFAEAAEKYQVYNAIYICRLRMRMVLPDHPLEIFKRAVRHNYPEIISQVAPQMIDIPLSEIFNLFPLSSFGSFLLTWIKYLECWDKVQQLGVGHKPDINIKCSSCGTYAVHNMRSLARINEKLVNMQAFKNLEAVFKEEEQWGRCACFKQYMENRKSLIRTASENVPKYTDLL